jgi:cytochrome c
VLLGVLLLSAPAAADEAGTLLPVIPPAAKGEACVEPTDVMRRDHMQFLTHQRDDTVHGGIRGAKHSLVGCIDCHAQADAQGDAIPVNARDQFCESCHRFTGASLDCFECHATVPAGKQASTTLPGWMSSPTVSIASKRSPGAR